METIAVIIARKKNGFLLTNLAANPQTKEVTEQEESVFMSLKETLVAARGLLAQELPPPLPPPPPTGHEDDL